MPRQPHPAARSAPARRSSKPPSRRASPPLFGHSAYQNPYTSSSDGKTRLSPRPSRSRNKSPRNLPEKQRISRSTQHFSKTLRSARGLAILSPLAGMKLKKLSFTPNPELKGLQAIRQMNSLVEIGAANDKVISSNEFWKQYDEGAFSSPRDSKPVTDVKSPEFEKSIKRQPKRLPFRTRRRSESALNARHRSSLSTIGPAFRRFTPSDFV